MRHILPSGFYKIRYYGLLASANCSTKKLKCIALLDKKLPVAILGSLTVKEILVIVTGINPTACPKCKKGKMVCLKILPEIKEKPS